MLDVLFFGKKDSRNLRVSDFMARYPGLKVDRLWFNDPSTIFTYCPGNDEVVILQDGNRRDLQAKVYAYYPRFFERELTNLFGKRPRQPYRGFADRQGDIVTGFLESTIGHGSKWINSPSAARRAANKLFQLSQVRSFGISLVESLISNDLEAIKTFVGSGPTVFKTICEGGRIDDDRVTRVSTVTAQEILEPDAGLEFVPGCFQRFIQSDLELRTFIFGAEPITICIRPLRKSTFPDIRNHRESEVEIFYSHEFSSYETQLRSFKHTLGLEFCAIDSLVIKGEIYFLEVNPSGTWYWLPEPFCSDMTNRYHELLWSTAHAA